MVPHKSTNCFVTLSKKKPVSQNLDSHSDPLINAYALGIQIDLEGDILIEWVNVLIPVDIVLEVRRLTGFTIETLRGDIGVTLTLGLT